MALGTNAKIELIKSAPLFENCSKQELQQIARIADELDIRAGKVLIREGERGREFFVIVSGEVEVRRKGRKMATLGPGSFVGEMALLSKIPRVATVTAVTPLDVLVITDRAFMDLLEKTPSLTVKVARTLAERVGANELSDLRHGKQVGAIEPRVRELAQQANFAAFTVHLRSGAAMTHVMWVDADDDHVLINTEVHRAKFRAVERDPRVTVVVWERDDPYRYVEVRGRVVETVRGPEARAHIDALSQKYRGYDYRPEIQSERVILRIAPDVQHTR